jgi:flagellar motor component MotA
MKGANRMKHVIAVIFTLAPLLALRQETPKANQIREALMPLPELLRDSATVVLDASPGKRVILRKGGNGLICRANSTKSMFDVYCHTQELDAFYTRFAQLALEGKSNSEIRDIVNAEVASGKLKSPPVGAAVYEMSGDSSESSLPLMAIYLPYATSTSTGLSSERDHYRPWLM